MVFEVNLIQVGNERRNMQQFGTGPVSLFPVLVKLTLSSMKIILLSPLRKDLQS